MFLRNSSTRTSPLESADAAGSGPNSIDETRPRRRRFRLGAGIAVTVAATVTGLGLAVAAPASAEVCIGSSGNWSCSAPRQVFLTEISLAASSTTVPASMPPTLTATVNDLSADGENPGWIPLSSGTVTFTNSTTGLTATTAVVNGSASWSIPSLTTGIDTVSAHYNANVGPGPTQPLYNASDSNTVAITVTGTVASPPTGLAATPGNRQLALSWTAPANTGGSAINEYKATATNDVTGAWAGSCATVPSGTAPAASSCTITGLTNSTTYNITVNAQNSTGLSPSSVPITATPKAN